MGEEIAELAAQARGTVVTSQDKGYEEARRVWNGRVDRRPALILRAADAEDVRLAVRLARDQGLPLAVRGGGHHPAGHGVCDAGVVVDLSAMKGITLDSANRSARVGPGLTVDEFARALQAQGWITTVGSHGSVGMTGLTLGGGLGILMGRYGLACDNLLGVEIVTADGRVLQASEMENPDLFWAVRGGGGNFGVVTALTFRIHPAEPILGGVVVHPMARAAEMLRFFRDYTQALPDELSLAAVLQTGPQGHPVALMMACHSGPLEAGERLLTPVRAFGPPLADHLHPMPYTGLLDALEGQEPAGAHYAYSFCALRDLTDSVINTIAAYGQSRTSPQSVVVVYHQHGAASRVPIEATAYAARGLSYFVGIYTGWGPADPADKHLDWLQQFRSALSPEAAGECCMSLISDADAEAVRQAYGANYARLQAIKQAWDPDNLFCHNHNIPPA